MSAPVVMPKNAMSSVESESAPPAPRRRVELQRLARRIRSLRDRKGITQEQLAARAHISVSFASLLERGERSPSYETLLDVADALEVTLAELFRDAPLEPHDDPYYARLVEFARAARLARSQVDQLLAVGQALHGLEQSRRSVTSTRACCSEEGCDRPVLARGLCASHYHRARRARRL